MGADGSVRVDGVGMLAWVEVSPTLVDIPAKHNNGCEISNDTGLERDILYLKSENTYQDDDPTSVVDNTLYMI